MVREFKKVGAAAAVAGALLASSASYATVQLSAAGDVLLVPYVIGKDCGTPTATNTMVGLITFWKDRLGLIDGKGRALPAPATLANVEPQGVPFVPDRVTTPRGGKKGLLHWYFYNKSSVHLIDGVIPVTDNDFIRIDWCSILDSDPNTKQYEGVEGYMLFVDDRFDSAQVSGQQTVVGMPVFALYGHAYQIQGNWLSQAFIPVISNPVCTFDTSANQPASKVTCEGREGPLGNPTGFWVNVVKSLSDGYPQVQRLVSGIDFTSSAARQVRDVYLRYFLDPSLAKSNSMVFWFNNNDDSRNAAGETYNAEQVYQRSFTRAFPNELNIYYSTPAVPAFPGMIHTEDENGFDVVNTGILRFGIPEIKSDIEWASSGVAFNMLGLASEGNPLQLQTEMATEGSEYPY